MARTRIDPTASLLRPDGRIDRRSFLAGAASLGVSAFALPAAAQSGPVNIGWVRASTGRLASLYAPQFVGGLIAVDEINAAGGIMGRPIARLEEDDEASPAKQPQVAKKLLDAKPLAVVGPSGSSQALASVVFTGPAKVLQACNAAAAEMGDGTKYPYHYQCMTNTVRQSEIMVRHLRDVMNVKRIGVLQENTAFGEQGTAATLTLLKSLGVTDVPVEVYPLTAPDLSPYIRNLRNANVDGVVAWIATVPAAATAFNAMYRLKWNPPVVGHNGICTETIFDHVPPEAVANVYSTYYKNLTWWGSKPPGDRQIAYAKKIAAYPESKAVETYVATAPYYDFVYLLKHGVETARSWEPEKIKAVLDNTRGFKGMLGTFSFTPTNHSGLAVDELVLVSIVSARSPQALGVFRERLGD